jgi:serine/threonine protein kinase
MAEKDPSTGDISDFELSRKDELESTKQGVPVSPKLQHDDGKEPERYQELTAGCSIGRYVVIRTLGRGGFGTVYLANDTLLGRNVAIKMSRTMDTLTEKVRTSLVEEARSAASIDHPNIVRVYDVDKWEDRTYVVMELVNGISLSDEIAKRQTIPLQRVIGILKQIAIALEQLHAHGIVHRDLKPANILLTEHDQVKVTDLGLALTDDSPLWRTRHVAGTQRYMSPEQVLGEVHRIDGRTDIWAFGVVAYELLTLQSPFRNTDQSTIYKSILKSEIASPRQRRPDIPDQLERICLTCLSRQMTIRFQSAKQLIEAFDAIEVIERSSVQAQRSAILAPQSESGKAPSTGGPISTGDTKPSETERKSSSLRDGSELRGLVPRGLRSFTEIDSAFYQRMMPGPYDIEGRPWILNMWKKWVETPSKRYENAVGVIYGPSGCGKSSFVRAALIPSLHPEIVTVYFNFTVADPIANLVSFIQGKFPFTTDQTELPDVLGSIRRREDQPKLLLVLDQFEQFLIDTEIDLDHVMVQALRQCDGVRLQAIILVRDEFWSEVSHFMHLMETSLTDEENASNFPLMNKVHARRVLEGFGRAYEMLPSHGQELSPTHNSFLDVAIDELAQDATVLSVRIAMFAEVMKNYPWQKETLVGFGGVDGALSRLLSDSFFAQNAIMSRKSVGPVCAEILRALLPDDDREIKSVAKSVGELQSLANEPANSVLFQPAIRCLEFDLRLITPSNAPNQTEACYNLSHDYLVKPIRDWLDVRDSATWQGRIRRRVDRLAKRFQREPTRSNLLSTWEWGLASVAFRGIQTSNDQRRLLHASRNRAAIQLSLGMLMLALFSALFVSYRYEYQKALANRKADVENQIVFFCNAKSEELDLHWIRMQKDTGLLSDQLRSALTDESQLNAGRLLLLRALCDNPVDPIRIEIALKKADTFELNLWSTAMQRDSMRHQAFEYIDPQPSILGEWHWIFIKQNDYRLLSHIDDALDPTLDINRIIAVAATESDETLIRCANELIQASQQHNQETKSAAALAARLTCLATPASVEKSPPLTAVLEDNLASTNATLALNAQVVLSRIRNERVLPKLVQDNPSWKLETIVEDNPFVMIHVPPGSMAFDENDKKGNKKYVTVDVGEDVWLGREEVDMKLFHAFLKESPVYNADHEESDEPVDNQAQRRVRPRSILAFCNWLSEKANRSPVYFLTNSEEEMPPSSDWQKIPSLPQAWIRLDADGFRLPRFDEYRYASLQGDYTGFWRDIAKKDLNARTFLPDNRLRKPTWEIMPDGWGFQGLIGNAGEYFLKENNQIATTVTIGVTPSVWNSAISIQNNDAFNQFTGFRVARGATKSVMQ